MKDIKNFICQYTKDSIESKSTHFDKLSTLCDDPAGLTCSFHVAKNKNIAKEILGYPSFEEAAISVKENISNAFLVPGAYPKINTFIMDPQLVVKEVFIEKIPALVFATYNEEDFKEDEDIVIYHHPAVTPLLSELNVNWTKTIHASSNSQACRLLIENPKNSRCITNQICVQHYKLKTIKILRTGIQMPWLCIEKIRQ